MFQLVEMNQALNHIEALAWICIRDRQVLITRTRGKDAFYFPGGKPEVGESTWQALRREIQEEVGVTLIESTLREIVTVEDMAHGYHMPTQVRMACFQADYFGEIQPRSEIEEIAWITASQLAICAPATQQAIQYLQAHHLID